MRRIEIIKRLIPFVLFTMGYSQTGSKPNILFIAVDDMNDWGITALNGRSDVITPNLDKLAESGVLFTNAHTNTPACHPSRVAMMTGVHPLTSQILSNVFDPSITWRSGPKAGTGILADVKTIPQYFMSQGYKAMGGGKIFHSLQWGNYNENEAQSWDEYFPSWDKPIPNQIRSDSLSCSRKVHNHFTWEPIVSEDSAMSDYKVADWAIGELQKDHGKPFFLMAGIFRPHMPWEVPQKYYDMYGEIGDILLPNIEDPNFPKDLDDAYNHGREHWHRAVIECNEWKEVVRAYMASITFADAQIGRILKALDESKYKDNTIVVLWSDHGMHIGEKENWEKFTLWEESTRIPFIIRAPGFAGNQKSSIPVSSIDLYPTLVELTGGSLEGHYEGESLVPLLLEPTGNFWEKQFVSISAREVVHGDAVRTKNYKYTRLTNGTEELYHSKLDLDEFINLVGNPGYDSIKQVLRDYLPIPPINNSNQIKIISPNSNTPVYAEELYRIKWTDKVGKYRNKIELNLDGSWMEVNGNIINSGTYNWIPSSTLIGKSVKLRITSGDGQRIIESEPFEILSPRTAGCMDSIYAEFNSNVERHDQRKCLTPISSKPSKSIVEIKGLLLKLNPKMLYKVTLWDLNGRILKSFEGDGLKEINWTGLEKGMYLLSISTQGKTEYYKVILGY